MRIVILGPPGSGKGSQARRVATHYQLPYITVQGALGDIAAEDSELGRLVKETLEANRVSDELMLAVLRVRLGQADVGKGFVLDGFPRTASQADTLDLMLDSLGRPVDVVMLIDVDPDDLMERLVGRLTCEGCGTLYNLYTNPPTVDGVCDRCGGRVSRRPDDYEETISNRLRIFESQTAAVIEHYKLRGKLRRVAGGGEPDAVFGQVRHIVDATPRTVIEMEPVAQQAVPLPETEAALLAAPRRKVQTRKPAAAPAPAVLARERRPAAVAPARPAKAPAAATQTIEKVAAEPAPAAKPAAAPAARPKAPAAKPAAAKRPSAERPAQKAAAAKAVPSKKPAAGKTAAAKASTAPKKAAKKPVPAKPPSRKVAGKAPPKAAAKKLMPKKAAPKKAAAKKAPARKGAAVAGKPAAKKAPARKPATKKTPARKGSSRSSARVAPRSRSAAKR
jgi:adenylate kinase